MVSVGFDHPMVMTPENAAHLFLFLRGRITITSSDNEDLLSWKSLRDINQSLAPLFTIVNPETGSVENIGKPNYEWRS